MSGEVSMEMKIARSEEGSPLPRHVAIIMDGNGRWAREKGLPRIAGHRAGVKTVREIVKASLDLGIPVLTIYAFSQENWKRPKEEVTLLMELLDFFLNKEIEALRKQGVSLRTIGRIEALPPSTLAKVREAVDSTRGNSRLVFNIALNYGARQEILDAVRAVLEEARRDPRRLEDTGFLTERFFSQKLYTSGLPDPDLLIRTSGEMRLSNFLLWQLSYSEIYITKKYWPDFTRKDYLAAIREYRRRERRFGDVPV
jgi:undecaprenyl diphosphate synthase